MQRVTHASALRILRPLPIDEILTLFEVRRIATAPPMLGEGPTRDAIQFLDCTFVSIEGAHPIQI